MPMKSSGPTEQYHHTVHCESATLDYAALSRNKCKHASGGGLELTPEGCPLTSTCACGMPPAERK